MVRSALVVASIVWALAMPLAAYSAAQRDASWSARHVALAVYGAGSLVCHQRAERSFHAWNVQWPVCARCTGVYFGAASAATACLLLALTRGRSIHRLAAVGIGARAAQVHSFPAPARPRHRSHGGRETTMARIAIAAASAPLLATLVYEWITGDVPSNWSRAATGALVGAVVAAVLLTVATDPRSG
jgi:hypothetical protein